MARGNVRRYSTKEGWGIIDSPDTPGGCLIQSPAVIGDPETLTAGRSVEFEWRLLDNEENDFRYYATSVSLLESVCERTVEDLHPAFAGLSWRIDPTQDRDERMAAFWRDADD
ncbi:MAG: hypothetical protein ACOH2Q_03415, partial [Rhodococcus sp. (in: high G+C Gram-positive bacteria)]